MERRKPNRPSSLDRLPKELRDQIERLRRDGCTIDEIREHLAEIDVEASRSAIGRHIIPIDDMLEDVRKARHEVAEVARVLEETSGTEVSEVNRQLLEAEYFRQLKALRELEAGPGVDTLKSIASGMASNTRSRIGEQDLRRQADADAQRRATAKLDKAAASGEIDPEAVARAKRILGFD